MVHGCASVRLFQKRHKRGEVAAPSSCPSHQSSKGSTPPLRACWVPQSVNLQEHLVQLPQQGVLVVIGNVLGELLRSLERVLQSQPAREGRGRAELAAQTWPEADC